jgi:hypothetical protein
VGGRLRLGLAILAVVGIVLLLFGRSRRAAPLALADPAPAPPSEPGLDGLTRDELYARAQAAGIPGRSKMNKAQLRDALRGL